MDARTQRTAEEKAELVRQIRAMVAQGDTIETAAQRFGIATSMYHRWVKKPDVKKALGEAVAEQKPKQGVLKFTDAEKIALLKAYDRRPSSESTYAFCKRVGVPSSASLSQWRQKMNQGSLTASMVEVLPLIDKFAAMGSDSPPPEPEPHDGHTMPVDAAPTNEPDEGSLLEATRDGIQNGHLDYDNVRREMETLTERCETADGTVSRCRHALAEAMIEQQNAHKELAEAAQGLADAMSRTQPQQ